MRRYTAPPDDQRCTATRLPLADGSSARCMRRATSNGMCAQHAKLRAQGQGDPAGAPTEHERVSSAPDTIRCPFANPQRRKQFDGMLKDYRLRSSALFHGNGRENRSNNIGEAFWRGWHGERFIWDKEAPLYVAYRAGSAIANALGRSS